jgi:small-conductance mechanosensitive channel
MALLIGTAATDHLAKRDQPEPLPSRGRRIEMGRLVFVYRAAFVGFAAFAAALIGFGLQELLPAAYLATSKGMIGSIVGLIASLLSIVLGLLVWTSHGQFISQQTQLQTLAIAALQLDDELRYYGLETDPARALLRKHIARTRARFSNGQARYDGRSEDYDDLRADHDAMFAALDELRPTNGEQMRHLEKAYDTFRMFCATQATMIRSLADRAPVFLLIVVLGWSCVLFFGYGLLAGINVLAALVAALGAAAVASAILTILELSNPYSGLPTSGIGAGFTDYGTQAMIPSR